MGISNYGNTKSHSDEKPKRLNETLLPDSPCNSGLLITQPPLFSTWEALLPHPTSKLLFDYNSLYF